MPCEDDTTDDGSITLDATRDPSDATRDQYDDGNTPPEDVMDGTVPGKKLPPTGGLPLALSVGALLVAGGCRGGDSAPQVRFLGNTVQVGGSFGGRFFVESGSLN